MNDENLRPDESQEENPDAARINELTAELEALQVESSSQLEALRTENVRQLEAY